MTEIPGKWRMVLFLVVPWFCEMKGALGQNQYQDYTDMSFNCPVITTCPMICAATVFDCPTVCSNSADVLCADGTCRPNSCPSGLKNPCPSCTPFACAKTVASYDVCLDKYEKFYQAEATCQKQLQDKARFNEKPFALLAIWVAVVTVLTVVWSWMYHTPITLSLEENKTQTGYQKSYLGQVLYYCVLLTLTIFQGLILGFCIASYKKNNQESLRAFIVTWSISFVWTLFYKWPYNIQSVFFKACDLHQADFICVLIDHSDSHATRTATRSTEPRYLTRIRGLIQVLESGFHSILAFTYHMPPRGPSTQVDYLPVLQDAGTGNKYIVNQFRRYNYDVEQGKFVPGKMQVIETLSDIVAGAKGLTTDEVQRRLRIVGPNVIEMKRPSLFSCIYQEFAKAFYTYQLYMLWTWVPLNYWYMAIVHSCVIITGGMTLSWFRYRNETNLYKLTNVDGEVSVKRDGELVQVPQYDLVPGDIVVVAPGMIYTDMVLVSSEGVLVDESALTGESSPMAKTAVDANNLSVANKVFNPLTHKRHIISAGTTVLESENTVNNQAMVINTGSFTSKGELLRGVFGYQRHQFKFDTEVFFVLLLLLLQAIVGFIIVLCLISDAFVYAFFFGMYVVSAVLPPLLPTVFTVSVGISDNRLAKKRIACSNSEDILVAGKVKRAFFDKTGTLTRQGLDYISAKCKDTWGTDPEQEETATSNFSLELVAGMSCCHGLTLSSSGDMVGNPVDTIMFQASQASMTGRGSADRMITERTGTVYQVVKHFDFDHHRMTQSVIVRRISDNSLSAFVKGSSESLKKLCTPDSLPSDYDVVVRSSAKAGTYQISMAIKPLPGNLNVSSVTRDQIESELSFVGVINFKNVLREETPEVIRHLEAGEVRCVMVTGDSVLTGIRIAKEAGIVKPGTQLLLCSEFEQDSGKLLWIDEATEEPVDFPSLDQLQADKSNVELAMTGEVWEEVLARNAQEATLLAQATRVFGRCTPFHKVSVVSTFVDLGFITLMCGDGGNDCGALKAAHVGVALSDAEASIVSPFTSLDKTITSVVEVLKEGRCALASALASYKYVILYGQIEALTNIINAYFRINFTEYCWLFMDGFWVIGMSFSLPLSKAAKTLAETRPTSSILGPLTVSSVLGILLLNTIFAFLALFALFQQSWFDCRRWQNLDVSNLIIIGDNYESQTLFLVMGYQFISTAMAFNFGYEWRQGWFRNHWFVLLVVVFTAMHFWITLVPGKLSCFWRVNCANDLVLYSIAAGEVLPIQNPYHTTVMPVSFRFTLLFLMITNTIANMSWDYFVVNGLRRKWARKKRETNLRFAPAKETSHFEAV